MKSFKQNLKGFSLVELLLAIGIFTIVSSMLVFLVIDSTRALENITAKSKATQLTQNVHKILIMLKSQSWYNIAAHTGGEPKHLEYVIDKYQIVDGDIQQNGLTYFFTVEEILRDLDRKIVESDGSNDPHSRLITINVSWTDRLDQVHTISPKMYVNDWNTHSVVWTTQSEFDTGIYTDTMSEIGSGDGQVRLFSMLYGDWCNPSPYIADCLTCDLLRSGIPTTLFTIGDLVYVGTGGNAAGESFTKISILGDPPVLEELGTYNGYKVYDVFGFNQFALLATDNNSQELVVLDVSSPTEIYSVFTYLNIPNANTKQKYIFALGEKGYLTHDNKITIFSLNNLQLNVPPTVIQTVTIGDTGAVITDIYVDSNYIYATTKGGNSDFFILQNVSPYSILGQVNIGTMNVTSLFISEDTNRAYIGTQNNIGNEFFILDTSNKNTTFQILKSVDLGGMSVSALAFADNKVVIGGIGAKEYLVFDMTNELNPSICGELDIDAGINMIGLVNKDSNVYAYILSGDSNQELQIIRGGHGGGGTSGDGYVPTGQYLSEIFNSGSDTSEYYILGLKTTIPTGTTLKVQLRSSNDSSMAGSTWMGPNGTSNENDYYQDSGIFMLPESLSGRYFQYKVEFTSDTISTPLLEEIVINYEK